MCVPSLRVVAEPQALNKICCGIDELWLSHCQVPPRIRFQVEIAVNEIAANIVKHATKGIDRPVDLRMRAIVGDNDVLVVFADDGIPAPNGLITREMPNELDESGRGIPLARSALHKLEYLRCDERNLWTLLSERF